MGQKVSKKPKLEINEVDRAVLTLKSQARKLQQQRGRIQGNIDREMAVARELVGQGRKERALLALKRRKLQEGQAAKLDAWLLNVEQMLLNIESTQSQQRIFSALKEGTSAMKEMQQGMPLEEVEQLMQDSADAKDYEDSLRQMLGEFLNPEEADAAAAELQELEQQLMDAQRLELPRVPEVVVPPAAAEAALGAEAAATEKEMQQQQPEAMEVAEGAEAEALAELPSVPQTQVRLQAAAQEEEPEREMMAA